MKRFVSLSVLFLMPVYLLAQWFWLNPTPQGNSLHDVLIDDTKGIIVGSSGSIVLSDDGGATWFSIETFTNNNLASVCKSEFNKYFIAGDKNTLLKSFDGGHTWEWCEVPVNTNLTQVFFVNPDIGFCTGDDGVILKTTDGGENWSLVYTDNTIELKSIFFTNEINGVAVGKYNAILHTTDGGLSWTPAECFFPIFFKLKKVTFTSASVGYIIGDQGFLFKTTDAGATWFQLHPVCMLDFTDIYFADENNGYIVSAEMANNGSLLRTSDAGNTWQCIQSTLPTPDFVWANNSNILFIGGSKGEILKSVDNGNTFTDLCKGIRTPLNKADFPDSETGYVAGSWGALLKTTDAGNTWDSLTTNFYGDYIDLHFFTPQKGIVLTIGGHLLKTENGGIDWTVQSLNTNAQMRGLTFTDDMNGYACGGQGRFFKTTDGGETWTADFFSPDSYLFNVKFISNDTGFVVGEEYFKTYIMRTVDAGNSWTRMEAVDSVLFLFDIARSPTGKLFAVGNMATIIVSDDGGEHWTKLTNTNITPTDLTSICFTGNGYGFITSSSGHFYGSADGGETWQDVDIPAHAWLSHVVFTSSSCGYIVGSGGTILKTNPNKLFLDVKQPMNTSSIRFKIYPNPAYNEIMVEKADHTPINGTITIRNLNGVIVYKTKKVTAAELKIPIADFSQGVYFITIAEKDTFMTRKLIKLE